jgi:hypothetical protein
MVPGMIISWPADRPRVTSNDGHTPVFNRGVVGVGRTNGVWGHAEETTQFPPSLVGGVFGSGIVQPGVIGFSRISDGVQALSFTGTCLRAASSFGPGVHSISGALTGVTGISGTQGPTVQNTSNIAGVLGTSWPMILKARIAFGCGDWDRYYTSSSLTRNLSTLCGVSGTPKLRMLLLMSGPASAGPFSFNWDPALSPRRSWGAACPRPRAD